ncbi:MAG: hypothetical protein ACOCWB_05090 [Bacteroidota bacterium]
MKIRIKFTSDFVLFYNGTLCPKAQIQTLINKGILQLSLFEGEIIEVEGCL